MNKSVAAIGTSIVASLIALAIGFAGGDNGVGWAGLPLIVWCVVLAFGINWIAFVPSWLGRTEKFYDLVGAITYFVTTFIAVAFGNNSATSLLMAILIWTWCTRLGLFLFARIRADGKDGRFDRLKQDPSLLFRTWSLQGLWVSLTACAAWAAMTAAAGNEFGPLVVVGLVIWIAGFVVEVIADRQKSAFRSDPANRGRFISTGLWAWSRHPNYFGEIALWTGMAVMAVPSLSGAQYVTLVSPVFVLLLLTRISGVPLLERRGMKKWGDDPAYQQYVASTPALMLRPPRN